MTKLPPLVEEMMARICSERGQPPPEKEARENLMKLGEPIALHILSTIYAAPQIIPSFSAYINSLFRKFSNTSTTTTSTSLSPNKNHTTFFTDDGSPRTKYPRYSPISTPAKGSPRTNNAVQCSTATATIGSPRTNDAIQCSTSPASIGSSRTNHKVPSSSSIPAKSTDVLTLLSELEFRKAFLVLSYIGRNKVEDVMSVGSALELLKLKDHPMENFESRAWTIYGQRYLLGEESSNRRKYLDWDSGRTHSYYCHVSPNGNITFKGPCLDTTKTHLQRALGDENILIVKFNEQKEEESANFAVSSGDCNALHSRIAEEGIVVGLRRYRLLGFKDGGREEKKKNPSSSAVKFYFVRMESMAPSDEGKPYVLAGKTLHEARCLFMHLHMTSSMAKYASRFSLILSKTIKLQVELDSVVVEEIDDIPCCDQNGCPVYDEDGEPLIHTDGTGYISEDLLMNCPKDFYNAKYIKDKQFETSTGIEKATHVKEPPLLVQCRLFKNGFAVKGTLLVNKTLGIGRIQVRRSMIKVRRDSTIPNEKSFNSLEVVAISHKPRRCTLSKNLIALLSFGGVPKEFFLELLANGLEDARRVFSNKGAALRFLLNHGDRDDVTMATEMIMSGVPLDEPVLQNRLSHLASEERKGLQGGKLPISESFYLMGTADPTGTLNCNQVCVILDNGQFSGDVLVYRNPGLHFGDVHVLKATYVEALSDVVGNAKYAIFFSTKGERSMASEIGDGDLDGDMYWVSYNPQLLASYKASPPWKRTYSTPHGLQKKPSEFSFEQLEQELFRQYLRTRKQSNIMGMAADSWLAFMDRLLILGDDSSLEKEQLKKTMMHLVDIYYDALDAVKSGKKVEFPKELKAERYPHYMERGNEYNSKSVLGLIYDTVKSCQADTVLAKGEDIWKLPYFENAEIPDSCLTMWKGKYNDYKREMFDALNCGESKHSCADDIVKKYKQILYGAEGFEESDRKTEDIYNDALALYHAVYDYAKSVSDAGRCLFAWKVAGSALCKFHILQKEGNKKVMVCSFSTLKELMSSRRAV